MATELVLAVQAIKFFFLRSLILFGQVNVLIVFCETKSTYPLVVAMMFFGLFNHLNLVYGKDWLNLPTETLQAGMLRLLGV